MDEIDYCGGEMGAVCEFLHSQRVESDSIDSIRVQDPDQAKKLYLHAAFTAEGSAARERMDSFELFTLLAMLIMG
jgi:hypothetical protein